MMEAGNERLFRVLGEVGNDLVATAETKRFGRNAWQKWLPVAACLVILVGLGYLAVPYLTTGTESCPAAQPETPMMEALTPQTPEKEQLNGTVEQAVEQVLPKERLVFWDVVYYVEAVYPAEQAVQVADGYLGQVSDADDGTLVGAEVFLHRDSHTRTDWKEREVPLEILVFDGTDYRYCLTYYELDLPVMEYLGVLSRWHGGELNKLVSVFVEPMELWFEGRSLDGTEDQEDLLAFFLGTLSVEMEAGRRTEDLDKFLWFDGRAFVIPDADIRRQLDKYLESYDWQPMGMEWYDAERQAVVLPALYRDDEEGSYLRIVPERCAMDEERDTLVLVVERYAGQEMLEERRYQIRFTDERCLYEAIVTLKQE